jgi:hypothetical protein
VADVVPGLTDNPAARRCPGRLPDVPLGVAPRCQIEPLIDQAAPPRGAGPGASARAQPQQARPARTGPHRTAPLVSTTHSSRAGRCCSRPSSWRSILPLPATVSRPLPAVASHAIGYAEPRHGTRSQGIGAYQEDGRGLNPGQRLDKGAELRLMHG